MSQVTPIGDVMNDDEPNQMSQQTHTQTHTQMHDSRTITPSNQINIPNRVEHDLSAPDKLKRKEFFGMNESDIKLSVLVFATILILSSSVFLTGLRSYVPSSISPDGKNTVIGSVIAALIGTLIFILIKVSCKY